MTRFRPYPTYKDSGVEWLGRIPEHWEVKPFKALLSRNNGGVWGEDFDDDGVIVLRSTEQTAQGNWRIEDPARRSIGPSEAAAARLEVGDLVVTKSSGSSEHIGKTSVVDECVATLRCCFSNFMQRLRLAVPSASRFYWYYMNSHAGRAQLVYRSSTTTGLGNLSGTTIGSLVVPAAPADERDAIAMFLDRETQRIDALVEKKERLVELLQEKRTALISHAVTKGLDPNVRLKDTGVEWLGRIPEQWEYSRVGHLILSTNAGEVIDKSYWHDGDELLFTCQKTPVRSWFSPFPDWKRTKTGDVLLTRNGTPYAFLPPADAIYTNVVQRVRLHPRCQPEFAFLVLNQAADTMRGFGDIIESFNMGVWRETWLPLPPAAEQNRIVAFVDRETQGIDAMVEKARRSVELLKEYRTALISAAVTGKIDVKGAA